MSRKRWNKPYPRTMQEALKQCLEYAKYKHNRGVKRVADLNGISEWVVYKWMQEGSIPSKRIAPFELACGTTFVTEYLGANAQKLMIDIPRGAEVSQDDLLKLQEQVNVAVSELNRFYHEDIDGPIVLTTLTDAMTALAGHRENVVKRDTPELGLFDGDEE